MCINASIPTSNVEVSDTNPRAGVIRTVPSLRFDSHDIIEENSKTPTKKTWFESSHLSLEL